MLFCLFEVSDVRGCVVEGDSLSFLLLLLLLSLLLLPVAASCCLGAFAGRDERCHFFGLPTHSDFSVLHNTAILPGRVIVIGLLRHVVVLQL